ncbi:MAG: 1-phosphofructokinase family hexose kinase [Candidatus Sericytochromatia bacterium]
MILTVTLNASVDRTSYADNFVVGKINRIPQPIELAGGKGLNVTRALLTLGYKDKVLATGFLGGFFGQRLEQLMNEDHINYDFFHIKNNTRCCLAIIDKKNNTLTEINENGPFISEEELKAFFSKLENLCKKSKILVVAGSLPHSLPDNTYAKIIDIAKSFGLITLLDAKDSVLKNGLGASPYIIKPNRTEAETLLGFTLKTEEALIKGIYFLSDYSKIACITLDKDGCIIGNKNEIYKLTAPEIEILNTVGSGDSFLAGMIHAFLEEKNILDIAKYGIACGSANAMTEKAGFFKLEDVYSLLEKIKYKKIL